MNKCYLTIILTALFLTSCGSAPQASDNSFTVLASTTILADIAQNVAGDRVHIKSLLPVGTDPHVYQPAPSDVAKIAKSNLLILNGLDYEHFIESLLENAGSNGTTIEASAGIEPRTDNENEHGVDPHMWLDPYLVIHYVENIRDGLIQADPEGRNIYTSNADVYILQLRELDIWIQEQVNSIPRDQRLLVTNHETLGYFAEHYGFKIVDTVFPSLSSEAGISARGLANVIDEIKASKVQLIFLDSSENRDLADQIADETGIQVVDDLHLESLTDGPPAGNYIEMMKHNVMRITQALK